MTSKNPMDLQSALQRLDAKHGASTLDGQRRFKRFPVRAEVRIWPGEPMTKLPSPVMGQVRDISRGGMGILTNEPVTTGQFRRTQFVDGPLTIATMPAFCRYCQKITESAYLIGVEFGIEASIMLALGVTAKEISDGDESENQRALEGNMIDPSTLEQ